jgi:hypothetical protein
MPQSLSKVIIHIIFSTKNREPWLDLDIAANSFPGPGTCAKACIFFKGTLIVCKREEGARSTMQLLLIERSRAPVSLIRACPWACEANSNSYWSDQAAPWVGQTAWSARIYKQELFNLWNKVLSISGLT